MRKSDYLGLIGDLSVEYEYFEAAALRVKAAGARIAQSPSDTLLWYSQAYLIHNLYNSFEAYFLRVSKFFENNLPRDEWHKTLLDRMSVAVGEYRPAVLDAADRSVFHELGAFRHVVRHLYDREIDPKRMETAAESAPAAIKRPGNTPPIFGGAAHHGRFGRGIAGPKRHSPYVHIDGNRECGPCTRSLRIPEPMSSWTSPQTF